MGRRPLRPAALPRARNRAGSRRRTDVVAAIGKPGVKIVDARTTGEIEGRELRGARRGGIVPSAIPVYWEDALDPDTRAFKSAPALDRLYRNRGVLPEHDVIVYCQVGMRASFDLFMLHLLGYDKLKNYYGSWEEWGNREDLPIETLSKPRQWN